MLRLPDIGLGTSQNDNPQQCAETVTTALDIGYRHLDTAQMYGNEAAVGAGLARASVPRDDVVLATKVNSPNLAPDDVLASTKTSLEKLRVEAVDLLYVHWPIDTYDPELTLPAFDTAYDDGLTRNVAVSNFTVDLLKEAMEILDAPIVANQIEIHPLLPPDKRLITFCRDNEIEVVAYSPFCRGDALTVPEVTAVAEKHGVSPARTILAWLFSRNLRAIPKAVGTDHLRDNFAARELELTGEDIARIDAVDRRKRRFNPAGAPWNR